MIYFIQSGDNGPIKIGTADNPQARLEQLQTGNPTPLRLLATIEGKQALEADLHDRFAEERVGGEWFRPSDRLMAFVAPLASKPTSRAPTGFSTTTYRLRADQAFALQQEAVRRKNSRVVAGEKAGKADASEVLRDILDAWMVARVGFQEPA